MDQAISPEKKTGEKKPLLDIYVTYWRIISRFAQEKTPFQLFLINNNSYNYRALACIKKLCKVMLTE